MKANDFAVEVSKLTGTAAAGALPALRTFERWLGANHAHLLTEPSARLTFGQAVVALAAVRSRPAAAPAPPVAAKISSAISTPAPKPVPRISTEVIAKLAAQAFGSVRNATDNLPEASKRETCLRLFWQSYLDASLPSSLRAEMTDFGEKFWRPGSPTGYARTMNSLQKISLAASLKKLNLA